MLEEPLTYKKFRTGYTYYDIYHMVYSRKYKRRHGVLGFRRELKLRIYEEYLRNFGTSYSYVPSNEPIPD